MSQNDLIIRQSSSGGYDAERINRLTLSDRLKKSDYEELFYFHITSLLKFKLVSDNNNTDEIKLNEKNYLGIEQFTFENTLNIENDEPKSIDWNLIDIGKEQMYKKIGLLLKNEAKSNVLKPIVDFTVSSFENWLIYNQLHPNNLLQ